MDTFRLRDDFIRLGQVLKAAGLCRNGGDAKHMIEDGRVLVNGAVETRRGKKLRDGDIVACAGKTVRIEGTAPEPEPGPNPAS